MKQISAFVVAIAVASVTQGLSAAQDSDQGGRYEGIAASENAVWVIDTRTGRVRKCTQEFADTAPACTPLSN